MAPLSSVRLRWFQDILSGATAGDEANLRSLYEALSPETFSERVFEATLSNLTVEPPPLITRDSNRQANAGTLSLLVLSKVSSMSKRDKSIKALLSKFYIANLDPICEWIGFSLSSEIGFSATFGSLHEPAPIIELYDSYSKLLLSVLGGGSLPWRQSPMYHSLRSPTFCNFLYQMWTKKRLNRVYLLSVRSAEACPGVSLMSTLLVEGVSRSDDGEFLMDEFSRDGFIEFARATVCRVIAAAVIVAKETPVRIMGYIYTVSSLLSALEKIVPHNHDLFVALTRFRYLRRISSFLRTALLVGLEKGVQPPVILDALCGPMLSLAQLSQDPRCRTSRNCADLISGGYLHVVSKAVSLLPAEAQMLKLQSWISTVSGLNKYSTYPAVLDKFSRTHPSGLQSLGAENYQAAVALENTRQTFEGREGLMHAFLLYGRLRVKPYNCDNFECRRVINVASTTMGEGPSKECALCSSVVYCSKTCQEEDWDRMHRRECPYARDEYEGRQLAKGWYSHSSRAFHCLMVEHDYDPNRSKPGAIAVLDYATTAKVRMDSKSLDGWWAGKQFDSCQPPEYLRPRYEALVKKYRSSKGRLHIVEAVMPSLGREGEIYLTLLLKKEGEDFVTLFSVSRYGSSDFETI
ncbi:hypothetical protein NMY22_g1491 [Coprinellus aureogranulatus]|nr:hypothetical protein NMY22_g1491 [Coprinellus aureogranulatus]